MSRDIGPDPIGRFHSFYLSASSNRYVQVSLEQEVKIAGPVEPFRSLADLLNAAHRSLSFSLFKNKWTTLMVQMALFPITGLGGFQSSRRNALASTSDSHSVTCARSQLVGRAPEHTLPLCRWGNESCIFSLFH